LEKKKRGEVFWEKNRRLFTNRASPSGRPGKGKAVAAIRNPFTFARKKGGEGYRLRSSRGEKKEGKDCPVQVSRKKGEMKEPHLLVRNLSC